MAFLKKEASPEFIDAVRQIEERADECFKTLLQAPDSDPLLEMLARALPPAPAVVFDIGGAAGAYAFPQRARICGSPH
jgi:hypothetical protein